MIGKYINKLIYNRKMKALEERLEAIEESLSAIREKIAPEQKENGIYVRYPDSFYKKLLKNRLIELRDGKANFSPKEIKAIAEQIVEMCPAKNEFKLYNIAVLQTIDPEMQFLADRITVSLCEKERRDRRFIHNSEEAYDYIIELLDL